MDWQTLTSIPAAYTALIGALFGGAGLKWLEHHFNKAKVRSDAATEFRNELREEVKRLRDELRLCEGDVEKYRDFYWKVVEENAQLKAAMALNGFKVDTVIKVIDEIKPGSVDEVKGIPN